MIGAILGDMIGSPYEFDLGNKSKEFPLFSRKSVFTDDTVMMIDRGGKGIHGSRIGCCG